MNEMEQIDAHQGADHKLGEHEMGQALDVQELGGSAGIGGGGGIGGGLLGGILAGALFGNGFNRNNNGEGCVTPSQLTAGLAGVTDANMNANVLTQLGQIQAAIPAAEGQVQLALAQSTGQLSNQINTNLVSATQGFANVNDNVNRNTAGIIAVGESIKDTVNGTSSLIQLAIANSVSQGLQNTNAIQSTIRDDGDKTRALIVAQNEAGLRQQITDLQIRLNEQRADARTAATEVTVTQNVNQNQAQFQQQQQQQQQAILLATLCDRLNNLQNAVATNSNLIVGNTGAVGTGPQTANPVNVKT